MAWTNEQARSATGNSLAFTNNVKLGSVLFVMQDIDSSAATGTPSDTISTPYALVDTSGATVGGQRITAWWGLAPSAGANTVTFLAGSFSGVSIIELSESTGGAITLDVHDRQAQSSTTPTSPSVTATANGSAAVGWAGSDNGAVGDLVAGAGFVLGAQAAITSSSTDRQGNEYDLTVSAGSIAAAWTLAGGTFRGDCGIAVFKVAAAGGAQNQLAWVRA
jgi:hypothetical protein